MVNWILLVIQSKIREITYFKIIFLETKPLFIGEIYKKNIKLL